MARGTHDHRQPVQHAHVAEELQLQRPQALRRSGDLQRSGHARLRGARGRLQEPALGRLGRGRVDRHLHAADRRAAAYRLQAGRGPPLHVGGVLRHREGRLPRLQVGGPVLRLLEEVHGVREGQGRWLLLLHIRSEPGGPVQRVRPLEPAVAGRQLLRRLQVELPAVRGYDEVVQDGCQEQGGAGVRLHRVKGQIAFPSCWESMHAEVGV
mmetsp:Transcript_154808/g.475666  ORF Transcript_154808/g.475666 Transcript_154808/m.475666 type:complete len:210 (-) Transcript_154808:21-650(-)